MEHYIFKKILTTKAFFDQKIDPHLQKILSYPPKRQQYNYPMITNNIKTNDDVEGSRAEATFQLCIREFSKFKESKENRLSLEPCVVRNLPWKILAMSKQMNNKEFVLGFFLQCNADSDSNRWSVAAAAELRLLHVTDPEKHLVKSI